MTQAIIPYRPQPGDPEDISQLIADFDSILSVVNGGLKDDNVAADAAIQASKIVPIPGSHIVFSRGTTPPASPQDGDLWEFAADATNGVYWLFRYNAGSASANKWEFIGGSPLHTEQIGSDLVTASGVYTQATVTVLTLARAGDYDITFGGSMSFSGTVAWTGNLAARIGAANPPVDPQAICHQLPSPAGAGQQISSSRKVRGTGVVAGDQVTLHAKTSSSGQGVGFGKLWIEAQPVRVS